MKTEIVVVLDRSGSMTTVKKDTEGGFDAFIEEQRKQEGEASLTLVQFDTEYEFVYRSASLDEVKPLKLEPRGMTALLDAIGKAIGETKVRLKALAKELRPDNVVFVILTDGQENSSREFSRQSINEMISKRKAKGWQFLFLGANQDAIAEAGAIGIGAAQAMTYAHDAEGAQNAIRSTSNLVSTARTGAEASYTVEDREKQKR